MWIFLLLLLVPFVLLRESQSEVWIKKDQRNGPS